MAEILGAVSAGVALAGVALKIGSQVLKLKGMWDDVKEIPENIKLLVTDVEMLSLMLQTMEADRCSAGEEGMAWSSGVGSLVITSCRNALDILTTSVDDLSREIESKKRLRRALLKGKLVLHSDSWTKIEKRCERVIWMLMMAQQQWTIMFVKRQPDLLSARLELSSKTKRVGQIENQPQEPENLPECITERKLVSQKDAYDNRKYASLSRVCQGSVSSSSLFIHSSSPTCARVSKAEYRMFLNPPNWISRTAWRIVASKSYYGFHFSCRMLSVVPPDATVFRYAAQGDLEGLRGLFDRGLASPFDVTPAGEGLLDCAMSSGDAQVVSTMIDWGLDFGRCFRNVLTIWKLGKLVRDKDYEAFEAIHKLAIAHNAYKYEAEDWKESDLKCCIKPEDTTAQVMCTLFSSNTSMIRLILPKLRPGHYELPIESRLCFFRWFPVEEAETLRYQLWKDGQVNVEDLENLYQGQIHLLNIIAACYRRPSGNAAWRRLAREVVVLSAPSYFPISCVTESPRNWPWTPTGTALHAIMEGPILNGRPKFMSETKTITEWRRETEHALWQWLEDLRLAGVDLNSYGKAEEKVFLDTEWIRSLRFRIYEPFQPDLELQLIDFTYGSEPKDWKFNWSLQYHEMVGEFWEMVEDATPSMVGAWVD